MAQVNVYLHVTLPGVELGLRTLYTVSTHKIYLSINLGAAVSIIEK